MVEGEMRREFLGFCCKTYYGCTGVLHPARRVYHGSLSGDCARIRNCLFSPPFLGRQMCALGMYSGFGGSDCRQPHDCKRRPALSRGARTSGDRSVNQLGQPARSYFASNIVKCHKVHFDLGDRGRVSQILSMSLNSIDALECCRCRCHV